jgi:hypothetical protein
MPTDSPNSLSSALIRYIRTLLIEMVKAVAAHFDITIANHPKSCEIKKDVLDEIEAGVASGDGNKSRLIVAFLLGFLTFTVALRAEETLHDPALPTVSSKALHELSNDRTRQRIMTASQSHFPGRCVCLYQTTDSVGRSCKGRHETVKSRPQPLCYPSQISQEMVNEWHRLHP